MSFCSSLTGAQASSILPGKKQEQCGEIVITKKNLILPKPTGPHLVGLHRQDLYGFRDSLIPLQIYFPLKVGEHVPGPKVFEERALQDFPPLEVQVYSHIYPINVKIPFLWSESCH